MKPKWVRLAAAMVTVTALAGCSTSKGAATTDTLAITASAAEPTFVQNWNIFSPVTQKGPAATFFYEPLIRVDHMHANKPLPWLAKSWVFSDSGKTLTFHLRTDVTWSDGKRLTAQDVAYTFSIPAKNPKLGLAPYPFTSIDTPNATTVVLHYPHGGYHDITNFANRDIVPAHIWTKQNLAKWTNPKPVGTGPFTLDSFSPQQIKLKARSNYWEGKFDQVKYVEIKTYGSTDTIHEMELSDQISWGTAGWQDAETNFVKKGKYNHEWLYPTGGAEGLVFNCQRAPTNNVHIRRALYDAIDPTKLLQLYNSGQHPQNPTGLDNQVWHNYLAPDLRGKVHTQNAAAARAELAASGFTVKNGNLTKDGKEYPINTKAVAEYANWPAFAIGMAQQWKQVLGLDVKVLDVPNTQLSTQEANGDFFMLEDFLFGGSDIWSALNGMLNNTYAPAGKPATSDYARFADPTVNRLLAQMAGTSDQTILKRDAYQIEHIAVAQAPYGPLHTADWFIDVNATKWTGWPDPKTTTYVPHTLLGPDTTLTIQHLRAQS